MRSSSQNMSGRVNIRAQFVFWATICVLGPNFWTATSDGYCSWDHCESHFHQGLCWKRASTNIFSARRGRKSFIYVTLDDLRSFCFSENALNFWPTAKWQGPGPWLSLKSAHNITKSHFATLYSETVVRPIWTRFPRWFLQHQNALWTQQVDSGEDMEPKEMDWQVSMQNFLFAHRCPQWMENTLGMLFLLRQAPHRHDHSHSYSDSCTASKLLNDPDTMWYNQVLISILQFVKASKETTWLDAGNERLVWLAANVANNGAVA